MKDSLKIIIPPFVALRLPSFDIASIKTVLEKNQIQVDIYSYYLDFANFIGGELYNKLMNEGLGNLIFGAILFEENTEYIVSYLIKKMNVTSSEIRLMIEGFKKHIIQFIQSLELSTDDVVYFHLYTNQLYTSVYFSELIKDAYNPKIVFGGYHCQGESGLSLLNIFEAVDIVVEKEIEISLLKIFDKKIDNNSCKKLDFFGTPDYSYFVNKLDSLSIVFIEKYISGYYLQVELTRGCWWGKCSFCSLNCESMGFRAKSKEAVIKDIETIESKYRTTQVLIYERISSDNWQSNMLEVSRRFPHLKTSFNLSFKVSQLQDEISFIKLKEIGANILVGTESFSNGYLKLMNKGQTVLESINLLKLAERHQVPCFHNIMYNLPGETRDFIDETRMIIDFIKHLPPPFDIEKFRLTFGTKIFNQAKDYKIKKIKLRSEIEKIIIPDYLKQSYKPFFWEFEMEANYDLLNEEEWIEVIERWRKSYYSYALSGSPKISSNLFHRENNQCLQIYDRREVKEKIITLRDLEAQIYKFCDVPRTKSEIYARFNCSNANKLHNNLNKFIDLKIMYSEYDTFLSLSV